MAEAEKVKFTSKYLNLTINADGVPKIEFSAGVFETSNARQIKAIREHKFFSNGTIKEAT